ncbi:MAG: polyprenyl synthetase family protein, partial [Acidimicrobiales bacterium]
MAADSPLLQLPGMVGFRHRVDQALEEATAADDELMAQMGGHLITAGGKRARPLFTVASAAALAADDAAIDAAVTHEVVLGGVSVELVQVGSLCHDDVIDEAATRRGVESVNARWGNLKAILAGDFLLAKASEIAASLGTEVAGLLAATIGRLCEGEVHELRRAYDVTRTEASYYQAIEGKTAALFATACRVGGIVGELPRPTIDVLTEFGRRYGMAFQIVDDVLDVVATDAQLGKPAGHDIAEGIYNLPVLYALEELGPDLGTLLGGPIDGADLDLARRLVHASKGVERSVDVARAHVEDAVTALAPLGPTPAAIALGGAAGHLLLELEAVLQHAVGALCPALGRAQPQRRAALEPQRDRTLLAGVQVDAQRADESPAGARAHVVRARRQAAEGEAPVLLRIHHAPRDVGPARRPG